MRRILALCFAASSLLLGLTGNDWGKDPPDLGLKELGVGDKAPALAVREFIKGDPVKSFEKGKVYIIEFWATFSGPSKAVIPHLTELQKKYKDVSVVGVAVAEHNPEKILKPFVKKMGDKMEYRVATDAGNRMVLGWLMAAGQGAIPTVFIVDGDGNIAWIGNPQSMDEPLEQIYSRKWDLKAARAKFAEARKEQVRRRKEAGRVQKEVLERQIAKLPDAPRNAAKAVQKLGGRIGMNANAIAIVDCRATGLTDIALKELVTDLKHLNHLQTLSFIDCAKLTDEGLMALLKEHKNLQDLQTFLIGGTGATNAMTKEIKRVNGLKQLDLARTKVTDAGLTEVRHLEKLQVLRLDQTPVTDAGIKELQGLTSLQELSLDDTHVTDAGMKHLKNLRGLRILSLANTKVTAKAVVKLKKENPRLRVAGVRTELKGKLKSIDFDSEYLGKARKMKVYLPPTHDPGQRYPVVYILDSFEDDWPVLVEELIASGKVPPLMLVGIAPGPKRFQEYVRGADPDIFDAHEKFFIQEVMPWAENKWGASRERKNRIVCGSSNSGPCALYLSTKHVDLFGHVIAFQVYGRAFDDLESDLKEGQTDPTRYMLVVGREDKHGIEENQKVEEILKAKKIPVASAIIEDFGHSRELCRERLPICLEATFGTKK